MQFPYERYWRKSFEHCLPVCYKSRATVKSRTSPGKLEVDGRNAETQTESARIENHGSVTRGSD